MCVFITSQETVSLVTVMAPNEVFLFDFHEEASTAKSSLNSQARLLCIPSYCKLSERLSLTGESSNSILSSSLTVSVQSSVLKAEVNQK